MQYGSRKIRNYRKPKRSEENMPCNVGDLVLAFDHGRDDGKIHYALRINEEGDGKGIITLYKRMSGLELVVEYRGKKRYLPSASDECGCIDYVTKGHVKEIRRFIETIDAEN